MKQIIALGDSIVRGIVLDKSQDNLKYRYTQLDENFVAICSAQLGCVIKNFGMFGNTTLRALHNLDRHKSAIESAEYVIMEFGGNDCDHHWSEIADNPSAEHHPFISIPQYSEQLHELIASVQSLGAKPILLSLPPIIADKYFDTFTKDMSREQRDNVLLWLNGCLENITQWHDMYNLALFKLASDAGVEVIDITTPFLVKRDYRTLFCNDGIHPNALGHKLIAETICNSTNIWN